MYIDVEKTKYDATSRNGVHSGMKLVVLPNPLRSVKSGFQFFKDGPKVTER